jgi:hypothetical protein
MLQLIEYEKQLYPDKAPTMQLGDWEVKGFCRRITKKKINTNLSNEQLDQNITQFVITFLTPEKLRYKDRFE